MIQLTRLQKGLFLGILCVVAVTLVLFQPPSNNTSVPEDVRVGRDITVGAITPSQVTIPDIGVNASIEHVGVNAAGNMAVPEKYEDVAWYEKGYLPGEKGHAVLAGHLDNGLGLRAVFADLDELKIGDTIYVSNAAGKSLAFRVSQKNVYNFRTAPLEKIFGPSDSPKINLITCNGSWLEASNTYEDRLVVTAELIDTKSHSASASSSAKISS